MEKRKKLPFEAITLLWFQSSFFRNIQIIPRKHRSMKKCYPFGHYEQQRLPTKSLCLGSTEVNVAKHFIITHLIQDNHV